MMMFSINRWLCLLFLVPAFSGLLAQSSSPAWWGSVELEKELGAKMSVELEQEYRYFLRSGTTDRWGTSLQSDYAFFKNFKAGVGYSWLYQYKSDDDCFASRHRYFIHAKYSVKLAGFKFSLREKFQSTYRDADRESVKYSPRNALKSQLSIACNVKSLRLRPYTEFSLRHPLNNPDGNSLEDYRWSTGVVFKLTKKAGLDVFYLLDHDDDDDDKAVQAHVFGTKFKYQF
ncbi:DUF2490 domain-containing protein [Geofilum rhodophaeum]|uniref:DUF2490 domain-containing protein n=1 Tax=Geofilum rhodophaeum TaxID=1965019 RepID=UPI000B5275F3|nr:DUF2490 domain-containing protein [Geofilum rhodophaeum]